LTALRHGWRLFRDARRLAAHGVLRPLERHPDVPTRVRLLLRMLRLGTAAPAVPDYAGGLRACGPAAVKLGQALATRADILGPEAAADLRRLQDEVPPVGWARIEAQLDQVFAGGWRAHFQSIDPVPVGAASIAQVHRAVTVDGRQVALKILRPGVDAEFAEAIASYAWAAGRLEELGGEFARLRPRQVIASFRSWTLAELDLRREAGNGSELAEAVRGEPGIRVPDVVWPLTTRRTLALEWIEGVKLTSLAAVDAAGADRRALAAILVRGFLAQAIGGGFFHADLHQGNMLLGVDGRLVLIDFGIMGRLDRRARVYLAEILFGLLTGNYRRVAEIHFEAGYVPAHHDIGAFASALRSVGEPIRHRAIRDISVGQMLDGLFAITRQFDMVVQPHLLLLQKTMVMVEGVAMTLDPAIDMWETAGPFVRDWIRDELGPEARLADALTDGIRLLGELPRIARQLADLVPVPGAAPPVAPLPVLVARPRRWPWLLAGLVAGLAAGAVLAGAGAAAVLHSRLDFTGAIADDGTGFAERAR
jgi:ubiquinone biosynthesis protein